MADDKINIKVKADVKQAVKGLNQVEKETNDVKKAGKGIFSGLKAGALAGAAAMTGVITIIKKSVSLFSKQEKAEKLLEKTFNRLGVAGKKLTQDFKKFASAQQEATKYGDELTLQAASQLAALSGLSGKGLEKATLAAQDLATAMDMDLVTAAQMLGKTIGTTTDALSRYIGNSGLDGVADKGERATLVIANLNDKFGGFAEEEGKNAVGTLAQASNAFGDLGETIGGIVMPLLKPLLDIFQTLATALQGAPKAIQVIIVALGLLVPAILAVNLAFGPMGLIISGVALVIGKLTYDTIKAKDEGGKWVKVLSDVEIQARDTGVSIEELNKRMRGLSTEASSVQKAYALLNREQKDFVNGVIESKKGTQAQERAISDMVATQKKKIAELKESQKGKFDAFAGIPGTQTGTEEEIAVAEVYIKTLLQIKAEWTKINTEKLKASLDKSDELLANYYKGLKTISNEYKLFGNEIDVNAEKLKLIDSTLKSAASSGYDLNSKFINGLIKSKRELMKSIRVAGNKDAIDEIMSYEKDKMDELLELEKSQLEKRLNLRKKEGAEEITQKQHVISEMTALYNGVFNMISMASSMSFDRDMEELSIKREAELASLDEQKQEQTAKDLQDQIDAAKAAGDEKKVAELTAAQQSVKTEENAQKEKDTINARYDRAENRRKSKTALFNQGVQFATAIGSAIVASVGAAEATSKIPIVGPIIAAISAATMMTAMSVRAYKIKNQPIPQFADGGSMVTNGPQMFMAGDNPSGAEKIDITPLDDDTGVSGNTYNFYGIQDLSEARNELMRQEGGSAWQL